MSICGRTSHMLKSQRRYAKRKWQHSVRPSWQSRSPLRRLIQTYEASVNDTAHTDESNDKSDRSATSHQEPNYDREMNPRPLRRDHERRQKW
uniref:Uncharacterized protein n=1 Tax=Steinernema glaseri TaxID=37863 RepID=A0A1I8AW24_9BILA